MDLIGKTIAQHRILANLGDGGMGTVYLAEHETIERRVAIKVLHRRFLHEKETVERFLNEARAANRIRHSGIVDIHDVGLDEQIGAYLVMEYLEGETLAARVAREGLLPIPEIGRIGDAVAAVLEAAHQAGIVHRDLKPANIFLMPDDQRGAERVKIVDFGIAKLFGETSMARTRTGELLGTPLYMSPEQCHGAKRVDLRTDIYSLGVILYQLLSGSVPFDAEGFGELIAKHLAQAPPALAPQRPSIALPLERVVLKALAKDPGARQQSMAELQQELAVALEAGVVGAEAPAPAAPRSDGARSIAPPTIDDDAPVEPPRQSIRRRGRLALALLSLALLGGATAAGYFLLDREDPRRHCKPGDLVDCRRQCDLGQQVSCLELARMYRRGDGVVRSAQRAATMLQKLCDEKLPLACRRLAELYVAGEGVRKDEAQAAILLRRACEAGSYAACVDAGQMYRDGTGVAPTPKLAVTLLRRSCDHGRPRGCLLLGEFYAAAPSKDLLRARPLLRRACEHKLAGGCALLAKLAEGGEGGRSDLVEAARYYGKACAFGDAKACQAKKRVDTMAVESRQHRRVGWVYLGEYATGRWRKTYFEIGAKARPKSLVGKPLRALRASNIRYAPPDEQGVMGRVIGGLQPESTVRVLLVREWRASGFIWARVSSPAPR